MNPVLPALGAAALWGLWWVPIVHLETLGLPGAWASAALNLGALPFALAGVVWFGLGRFPAAAFFGACLTGFAIMGYSAALAYTDVVRAILLFYLAPAWSKIIEAIWFGAPFRWTAAATVTSALLGAWLILGGDVSLSVFNIGDALAMGAGLTWAGGTALIFSCKGLRTWPLVAATCFMASIMSVGFALVEPVSPAPGAAAALGAVGYGAGFLIPILAVTLWSAQRLTPATLSFLLTAEIVTGVLSGVLILGEPFGLMRAIGAALIVGAALVEVAPALRRPVEKG